MPLGKRQRKLLLGSGLILVALLVFWLALPLWFPWLLRPLAAAQGAHYSTYTREGYSHFKVTGVTLTNRTVQFSADTLEALVPSAWVWKLARGTNTGSEPFVSITGWHFISVPSDKPSSPVYADAQDAFKLFAQLKKWLPVARLTNGSIRVEGTVVGVPALNWTRGQLTGTARLPDPAGEVAVGVDVSGTPPFRLEVASQTLSLRSQIRLLPSAAGLEIQSTSFWWSNQIDLYAQFARTGQVPQLASLKAKEFVLPAEIVHLAPYQSLTGSLSGKWERGAFGLDLTVVTLPPSSQTNLPRFAAELHARGDSNGITIDSAQLSAPWATARLSRELVLHFKGPLLDRPAQLQVSADLSRQTWLPLQGELSGETAFTPAGGKWPNAGFHLTGSGISYQSLTVSNFNIAGSFEWPRLAVTNASAEFPDGSAAVVTADVDLEKQAITNGLLRFNGGFANRWLQPSCSYKNLSLSANFEGPIEELTHRGNLEVADFSSPYLRPVQIQASWLGRQQAMEQFQLAVSAGSCQVQTQGAVTNGSGQIDLRLNSLSLLTNREPVLSLRQPVEIALQTPHAGTGWRLHSSPIEWSGPAGQFTASAELDWPQAGDLHLLLHQVSSGVFSSFIATNWPTLDIGNLQASANWSNGPANYAVELSGTKLAPGQNLHLTPRSFQLLSLLSELSLHGNADGLTLSNLLIYSQTSAVVSAKGFVPLTLLPATPTNLVQIESKKPLEFRLAAEPNAFFWKELTDLTGVSLQDPQLKLQLSGDWEEPRGEVDLRTRELRLHNGSTNLPTLTDIKVTLQLDRTQARLVDTHLLIQRQPVILNAQIPLDAQFWEELKEKKLPNWEKASAQLRIQHAQLAAFEPLFPNILAPQGSLNLDLALSPGGKITGELALQDARTRPLGDFGPIRDISARCRFSDQNLMIQSVSAQISGAPLNITGRADLRGTEWFHGQLPPFTLTLRGTNVPLVRQPEAVIRSDLDLTAAKTNGAPPWISGRVHLHDSFFLADLNALIPGKVAGPSRRPPYFSIDDPFLADWRLAVRADGVRFIKLSTPIFNGEVSANLVLQGTLKDPIALGDLKIDSGLVRFPFANLQVQQGLVTLASQDPYHPQLAVTASSKQFGYDIRMEVTGSADTPVIQFSSTPPLSSEQILLMVTAGQLPQGTFSLSSQQRAETMAMFLGKDLLAKIGLGDQTQERLTIRSGEEISDQGRPTYHVEYKLTERWSLVGEYDRFGDFNAGLKWRILSR